MAEKDPHGSARRRLAEALNPDADDPGSACEIERTHMPDPLLRSIASRYGARKNLVDAFEREARKVREAILGVDLSIFDKTIRYYDEVKGTKVSGKEALARAMDKESHKKAWYRCERKSAEEKRRFYSEVDVYPFRQPYNKRLGGFRWYRHLVDHVREPSILEYGCGSAALTEYLVAKFPSAKFTVADIPSTTLDFVKWKKRTYGFDYTILTIGEGKEGIPLRDMYDLIICQDVLEHTPNPCEIVTAFVEHLSPRGVLIVDFLNAPGGENLPEAAQQRESVKQVLKEQLVPLKAIDEPSGSNGLYVKALSTP